MVMEIRFLKSDDAGEWLRLRLEALRGDPAAFSASFEEYESLRLEEVIARLWSSGDAFVVGGFEGERLTAMAGFYRDKGLKTRHKGRIWGVYVTPSGRSNGAGRHLLQALLERAGKIEGLEQIMLSVTETQSAALALYRSLGFESFGREPHALKIGDRAIDEEYMVLRLRRE